MEIGFRDTALRVEDLQNMEKVVTQRDEESQDMEDISKSSRLMKYSILMRLCGIRRP